MQIANDENSGLTAETYQKFVKNLRAFIQENLDFPVTAGEAAILIQTSAALIAERFTEPKSDYFMYILSYSISALILYNNQSIHETQENLKNDTPPMRELYNELRVKLEGAE